MVLRPKLFIGIDPGTQKSGFVVVGRDRTLHRAGVLHNAEVRSILRQPPAPPGLAELCVEFMVPRGMPTSAEEMETMYELGRMAEAWGGPVVKITRHQVKMAICGSPRANDSHIRQAMIDLYGGKNVAIGGKKCALCKGKGYHSRPRTPCEECDASGYEFPPGPLRDVTSHAWQSLAVVMTHLGV